jgi:hypothetical protein
MKPFPGNIQGPQVNWKKRSACGKKQLQAGSQYEKPNERAQASKDGGQGQVGQVDQPKRAEKKEG